MSSYGTNAAALAGRPRPSVIPVSLYLSSLSSVLPHFGLVIGKIPVVCSHERICYRRLTSEPCQFMPFPIRQSPCAQANTTLTAPTPSYIPGTFLVACCGFSSSSFLIFPRLIPSSAFPSLFLPSYFYSQAFNQHVPTTSTKCTASGGGTTTMPSPTQERNPLGTSVTTMVWCTESVTRK